MNITLTQEEWDSIQSLKDAYNMHANKTTEYNALANVRLRSAAAIELLDELFTAWIETTPEELYQEALVRRLGGVE